MANLTINDILRLATRCKTSTDIIKIQGKASGTTTATQIADNVKTYTKQLGQFCIDKSLTASTVVSRLVDHLTNYHLATSLFRLGKKDLNKDNATIKGWLQAYQTNRNFSELISALPDATVVSGDKSITTNTNVDGTTKEVVVRDTTLTNGGTTALSCNFKSNVSVNIDGLTVVDGSAVNIDIKNSSGSVKPSVALTNVTVPNTTSFKIEGSDVTLSKISVIDKA